MTGEENQGASLKIKMDQDEFSMRYSQNEFEASMATVPKSTASIEVQLQEFEKDLSSKKYVYKPVELLSLGPLISSSGN